MNGKVALDTNIAIAVLNGDPAVVPILREHSSVCLPHPVLGELYFGALNSRRAEANIEREPISKSHFLTIESFVVIPAQAGIQYLQAFLDARFRGHDEILMRTQF
jgi:predicted nucleic acid-binding protein